jgi:hypothetical protein
MHVAGQKKPTTKKKASKQDVVSVEKTTKSSAVTSDKRANTKGVWEVSLDSGVVIGYYEGTPAKLASYVAYFHHEGRYIRKLNFVKTNITKVPKDIFKRKCCGKRFTPADKFCSRCGKKLRFELPARKNIKLNIEIPSYTPLEKSKW